MVYELAYFYNPVVARVPAISITGIESEKGNFRTPKKLTATKKPQLIEIVHLL
jgi:hypothetical protein